MSERRSRLSSRLVLGTALVAVFTGLLTGVPLERAARRLLEEDLGERADAGAEMVAAALSTTDVRAALDGDPDARHRLALRLVNVAEKADVDIATLVRADGRVVASSDPDLVPEAPDPVAGIGGWDLTRADLGASTSPVHLDSSGTDIVSAVAPVEDVGAPAFITVRAPATWSRRMRHLDLGIGAAVTVWTLTVAAGGVLVARRLVAPLERLGLAVRTVATGGAGEGLPRTGYTELDTLADEFERMGRAIATRERWLRALAGTVAHEVRNPAQALRLHLGLLRRELGGGPPRLDILDAELDLLEATVTSLLAFAEGAPARRQPTDLHALLTAAAPDAEIVAEGEGNVDPVLVARAVGNLARNSLAAGARSVRVVARRVAHGLAIEVADDGPGFDPAMVSRAFEPFARGPGDGSGLGLALVQAVARAHGGTSEIARAGPGGTVVVITLPDA